MNHAYPHVSDFAFPNDWYPPVDMSAAAFFAVTKVGPDEIQSIRGSTALLRGEVYGNV